MPTRETLHRFLQMVGKVRLAASPRHNHWWNVPLHLTGRGLTTRPMSPVLAAARVSGGHHARPVAWSVR